MTEEKTEYIKGIVVPGYGVASGISKNKKFPDSTIKMQAPFFKKLGLDLSNYFYGTINLDIAPKKWTSIKPWKNFPQVKWYENYPAEDFSFYRCFIKLSTKKISALIYYPSPETKISEFHKPNIIEVIAPKIENLTTGLELGLEIFSSEIEIS
ncbi:MAG: hypothetical protein R3A13_01590 [Bdellovibrionota bacterium]